MRRELDEALCRDFPVLFGDRNGDLTKTAMCWGFDCGDGWEPLIRKACEKIEALNNTLTDGKVVATQVKEKYGTLRFYVNYYYDDVEAALNEAETESAKTCETCGESGKLRLGGWLYTACDAHVKENK